MTAITIAQQIACVEREIGMRKRVYPRWIASGKLKQEKADHEISAMRAVLDTLRQASSPDPIGEALNSGDGTYRP